MYVSLLGGTRFFEKAYLLIFAKDSGNEMREIRDKKIPRTLFLLLEFHFFPTLQPSSPSHTSRIFPCHSFGVYVTFSSFPLPTQCHNLH